MIFVFKDCDYYYLFIYVNNIYVLYWIRDIALISFLGYGSSLLLSSCYISYIIVSIVLLFSRHSTLLTTLYDFLDIFERKAARKIFVIDKSYNVRKSYIITMKRMND